MAHAHAQRYSAHAILNVLYMSRSTRQHLHLQAFTIVELLIVIVVIAVLAVITVVTFNGLQKRAIQSSLQADVDKAKKKVMLYQAEKGTYPTAINCTNPSDNEICVEPSGSNSYSYSAVNTTNPPRFGLTASNNNTTYQATQSTSAEQLAGVVTNGLSSHLDASNSASYSGTGTLWSDISGTGRNATLTNVSYSTENGGVLVFNGTTSYARVASGATQSVFMMVYIDPSQVTSRYLLDSRTGNASGYIYNAGVGNWLNFYADAQPVATNWASIPKGRWVGFYTDTALQYAATLNVMSRYSNSELLMGKLGVVLVYNRALSQAEILQNLDAYRVRYGVL